MIFFYWPWTLFLSATTHVHFVFLSAPHFSKLFSSMPSTTQFHQQETIKHLLRGTPCPSFLIDMPGSLYLIVRIAVLPAPTGLTARNVCLLRAPMSSFAYPKPLWCTLPPATHKWVWSFGRCVLAHLSVPRPLWSPHHSLLPLTTSNHLTTANTSPEAPLGPVLLM